MSVIVEEASEADFGICFSEGTGELQIGTVAQMLGDFGFGRNVFDVENGVTETTPSPSQPTITETIVTAAIDLVTDPIGTILGWFGIGTSPTTPTQPTPSNNDTPTPPKPPVVPGPIPGTELFTVANAAFPTGKVSSTSIEYKFGGSITRTILYGEDGLPRTDIKDNYADTVVNLLSVDYDCDGTVNATTTFSKLYTVFDATKETSQVLVSEYLPLTSYGSHCFFFTVDVADTVLEKNEGDNVSNRYRFIVSEENF